MNGHTSPKPSTSKGPQKHSIQAALRPDNHEGNSMSSTITRGSETSSSKLLLPIPITTTMMSSNNYTVDDHPLSAPSRDDMENLVLHDNHHDAAEETKSFSTNYRSAMSTLPESHHHHPLSPPIVGTPADFDPRRTCISPIPQTLTPPSRTSTLPPMPRQFMRRSTGAAPRRAWWT
ncbi:hypothetical protein Fmac_017833 [Flemingia macrophylla]|uniref:Uncharacterized protein n=1 Tax=Flemingia macrophylla TaxID=520843 RepID=A0ABD1M368_9FABA